MMNTRPDDINPELQTREKRAPSSLEPNLRTRIQAGHRARVYLTERTHKFVLESQLPHNIVNLSFTTTN